MKSQCRDGGLGALVSDWFGLTRIPQHKGKINYLSPKKGHQRLKRGHSLLSFGCSYVPKRSNMGNPQTCDDRIAKRYTSSFNRKLSRSLWSCQRNVPPGNHRPDQNYLTPHNNLRDPSTKAGSFIARSSNRPVINPGRPIQGGKPTRLQAPLD